MVKLITVQLFWVRHFYFQWHAPCDAYITDCSDDVRVCRDSCSDCHGCCVQPAAQPVMMMLVQPPQPQPQPQQLAVCGTTAFMPVQQQTGCATEEQTKEAVFTMDQAPCKPCNVQCF